MQESSLHKSLKDFYTQPGDRQEVEIDGYLVDVVKGNHLFEVQTTNFSALKSKLSILLDRHPVRLVHPIPQVKQIIKLPAAGDNPISHRKSPKRGRLEDIFSQLVYIPQFIENNNFSLEVLLTRQEEIRRDDGLGSWRRKGVSIIDHRLIEIVSKSVFSSPGDYIRFIPSSLPEPFTTREIAASLKIKRRLAGKMVYTLRELGLIVATGKRGNAWLYTKQEL